MSRTLSNPDASNTSRRTMPLVSGGSGQTSASAALAALNGIPNSDYNQANGVVQLDSSGKLPLTTMPDGVSAGVSLTGPTLLYVGSKGVWSITNYDSALSYIVSCSSGFVTRADDKVYYTAPSTPGTYGFTINGKAISVTVSDRFVATPTILTPAQDTTNAGSGVTITSSTFSVTGGFPETILTASDKAAGDELGIDIALSADGTRLALGARFHTVTGLANAGQVYIYLKSGSTWTQEAILTASDKAANALFGIGLAITADGSRLIIGSSGVTVSGNANAGALYVFSRSGTTWSQEQKITEPTPGINNSLGHYQNLCIDSTGVRLAVTAYGATAGGVIGAGQAYVYTRSGTTWTLEATLAASDKTTNAYLGNASCDSNCTRLVLTARYGDVSGLTDCGEAYVFVRSGTTWTQEAILTASDKAASDNFGSASAITSDGSRIVIGASLADVNGITDAGAAYVFSRSGTTWTQEAKLSASDKATKDQFGQYLSISQDATRLAVGIHNKTNGVFSGAGKVYTFNRIGTTWAEEAKISASDPNLNDYFGISTAMSSDGSLIVSISHERDSNGILNSGAAYVYNASWHASTDWQLSTDPAFTTLVASSTTDTTNRTSWSVSDLALNTDYYLRCRYTGTQYGTSEWSTTHHFKTRSSWLPSNEMQILTASDKDVNDSFGVSISHTTVGSRLAVGALNKTVGGISGAGQVYIYTRSGSTYTQETTISASDKATNDGFGRSVAFSADGSRLAIGANSRDSDGTLNSGAVYIYTRSGSTYTLEATITASDKAVSDAFGTSVSWTTDGSRLAVGACSKDVAGVGDAGAVYTYTRSGSTYTQEAVISAADKAASDLFGISVSFNADGSRLAVGALNKTVAGTTNAGQVYIYTRSGSTYTQETTISASDKATNDGFGIGVSFTDDGSRLAIGAYQKTVSGVASCGQVYLYVFNTGVWALESTLLASDKAASDLFGSYVSLTSNGNILAIGAQSRNTANLADAGAVYIFQ